MKQTCWVLGIIALGLFQTSSARAQFNQYYLPVEQGILESHLDLQFQYSNLSFEGYKSSVDLNVVALSIEGQYAIADRFEVGLNVPFMVNGWGSNGGSSDAQFGDIQLNLKGRLFSLGEMLSLSLYANTYLPTHSGSGNRDGAIITPGVAVSARLLGLMVGGGVNGLWMLNTAGQDLGYIGFDAYGGYSLLGILTLKLAFQFANSIHPESTATIFAITPGVEVDLLDVIRVGVCSRIAVTDDAKYHYLGRASVLFHGGISF